MKYYTSTPNFIFDKLQPKLKPSEFSIVMVIVRQTYGWYDSKRRSHKKRDWISHRLFHEKTGLCHKTISSVIDVLSEKNIIRTSNAQDIELDKQARKFANKVYYELIEKPIIKLSKVSEEAKRKVKFLTDAERIAEILANKRQG